MSHAPSIEVSFDARVAELLAPQASEMVHATSAFAASPLIARALHRAHLRCARLRGTLDGVTLCRPETLARASAVEASGPDLVLQISVHWGLGSLVNADLGIYGPNPRSCGDTGYGGSFGFADPDARISVGYAMNRMAATLTGDPRGAAIVQAVYDCI